MSPGAGLSAALPPESYSTNDEDGSSSQPYPPQTFPETSSSSSASERSPSPKEIDAVLDSAACMTQPQTELLAEMCDLLVALALRGEFDLLFFIPPKDPSPAPPAAAATASTPRSASSASAKKQQQQQQAQSSAYDVRNEYSCFLSPAEQLPYFMRYRQLLLKTLKIVLAQLQPLAHALQAGPHARTLARHFFLPLAWRNRTV